jgi:ADP-ribose pyrophosphatase
VTDGPVFFCGPLAESALRGIVLRHDASSEVAADVAGHMLVVDQSGFGAALRPSAEHVVSGVMARLSSGQRDRLAHYATAMGLVLHGGLWLVGSDTPTMTYAPPDGGHPVAWSVDVWTARFAQQERALAADLMPLMGKIAPDTLAARLGSMRVRAASRVRAETAAPSTLRQAVDGDAVSLTALRHPYMRFFAVEEYDLTVRRFDGERSAQMTRAVFVTGDAVTVLPYDRARDRVLLVEQFRPGPMARGDPIPWSLEAIAGRIDPGETPEEAGRREAVEEAGLTLGRFWPVASYYPSPAGKTEFLYSFVAEADLPDGTAGLYGLADEAEDIRGHLVSFDNLMHLIASGEVCNAPVVLTAFWLAREKDRLQTPKA